MQLVCNGLSMQGVDPRLANSVSKFLLDYESGKHDDQIKIWNSRNINANWDAEIMKKKTLTQPNHS